MSFYQRNWFFTLNNPAPTDSPFTWADVKFAVWQLERGAGGTEHYQGYVQMKKKVSLQHMKKLSPRAHWEVRRGTHCQAKAYVTKEETRVAGPWEVGVDQETDTGQNGLTGVKRMIEEGSSYAEICREFTSECIRYERGIKSAMNVLQGSGKNRSWQTQTFILWGVPGSGKTRLVQRLAPDAYWLKKPGQGAGIFIDGYDGEEDFVIDEFYGWLPHDLLCRMCDRYPLLMDTKGGMVSFRAKRIWITSNKDPCQWYPKVGLGALVRRFTWPNGHILHFESELSEAVLRQLAPDGMLKLMDKYPDEAEFDRVLGSVDLDRLLGPSVCGEHRPLECTETLDKGKEKEGTDPQLSEQLRSALRVAYDSDAECEILARRAGLYALTEVSDESQ